MKKFPITQLALIKTERAPTVYELSCVQDLLHSR